MANNGLVLAGLDANNVFYNTTTIVAMLAGRYGLAALALVIAGRFAAQRRVAASSGTLPMDTPTFGLLLLGTIPLAGSATFLPALAMGPIVEFLKSPRPCGGGVSHSFSSSGSRVEHRSQSSSRRRGGGADHRRHSSLGRQFQRDHEVPVNMTSVRA